MRRVLSDHAREVVRSAFWPLPSLCVVAAIGLGIGLVSVDHSVGATRALFLFPGPPAGARSFLSSIIQAMITFTGLVFSITIVVLQLTSGQFSPRVLRTFLRDRTIQLSLGIFLATFVYAMVILRAVRGTGTHDNFVPRLAVTVSFGLVLVSVAMFIRYVAHIANMIRAATIVDSIGKESRACLTRRLAAEHFNDGGREMALGPACGTIAAREPGVIAAVDGAALVKLARAAECQLVMVPRVGDYVPAGAPLVQVYGSGGIDEHALLAHFSVGTERTLEQDLAFGFRQLVDIAQRALSPGINDPTTAVQAIDVLHDLLRRLATLHLHPGCHRDTEKVLRVVVPELSFSGYLGLAVGQIWRYGADSVQVPQRLTLMLSDLKTVALAEHQGEIQRWLQTVQAAGRQDPTWDTTLTVVPDGGHDRRQPPDPALDGEFQQEEGAS
ncbi:MAG TPA: DUF2254 domain-containing protein [Solirubrobacteraceae bacterium]